MIWKPIVVGVDDSPGSRSAATLAQETASRAGTTCHPVHATRDVWGALKVAARRAVRPELSALASVSELNDSVVQNASSQMRKQLETFLPTETVKRLQVSIGVSNEVVRRVTAELDASLIVIGQKSHGAIGRVFGTSTAELLLHTVETPVLIASPPRPNVRRVLVAVDFSDGAAGTIAWAERIVHLFGAKMRVLHVVELLPEGDGVVGLSQEGFFELCGETFDESIWSYVTLSGAEPSKRQGRIFDTIIDEAKGWKADLLVVASHGKGMIESRILGSTTRRLVAEAQVPMLVVPPRAWAGARDAIDNEAEIPAA